MQSSNSFLIPLAIFLIILTSFQNCADFIEPEHSAASVTDRNQLNFNGFKTTVFPVITQNCASCHGGGLAGAPQFAQTANPEGSFDTLIDPLKPLISTTLAPAQMPLVMEISGGTHNGISTATATNLANQVTAWKNGLPPPSP